MKRTSLSHDAAIIEELRPNSAFAEEYLKAALADEEEPRVLLVALCHIAKAKEGSTFFANG